MFILLYTGRQKDMDKTKYKFQREIAEVTSWINSPVRLCKINNLGPWRHGFYEFNKWYTFHCKNTHVYIIKNCISLYNDAWTLYFLQLSFQDVTKVIETSYRLFCLDADCQNNGHWLSTCVACTQVFTVSTDEINNNNDNNKNRSKIKKRKSLNYQCMTEFLLMASSSSLP